MFSVSTRASSTRSRGEAGSRCPGPGTPSAAGRGSARSGSARAERGIGSGPTSGRAATSPTVNRPSAQAGTSCTQRDVGIVGGREVDHLVEVGLAAAAARVAVEEVPAADEHAIYATARARAPRRSTGVHPLVRPRARRRARAAGRRRRARDLALPLRRRSPAPTATGAASASIRSRRASSSARALRLPLKAVEHLGVMRVARPRAPRRRCTCSGSRCRRPTCTSAFASPSVFTAHDLLPRRTAGAARSLAAAARAIRPRGRAHASAAARRSRELGDRRARHPASGLPERRRRRADDGRTLLSLGVIRPYKGLPDAIEATRRLPGRAPARRRRPGDAARRPARRRAGRVAARVPAAGRARPRALGGDRRRVPVPRRARPVRRAAAGARRRRARRSSTTSPVSASRSARSARARSCPPATSTR